MTLPAPTYDLVLVLDPQAADDARAKIVADARTAISTDGELLRHDEWGERPLAYPIERRTSGDYHLMQFHAGRTELLKGLDRNLRITDGILRFRIIRLAPGTPEAPDMRGTAPPPKAAETAAPGEPAAAAPAPADTAPDAAPADAAEQAVPATPAAPAEGGTAEPAPAEPAPALAADAPPDDAAGGEEADGTAPAEGEHAGDDSA